MAGRSAKFDHRFLFKAPHMFIKAYSPTCMSFFATSKTIFLEDTSASSRSDHSDFAHELAMTKIAPANEFPLNTDLLLWLQGTKRDFHARKNSKNLPHWVRCVVGKRLDFLHAIQEGARMNHLTCIRAIEADARDDVGTDQACETVSRKWITLLLNEEDQYSGFQGTNGWNGDFRIWIVFRNKTKVFRSYRPSNIQ